MMHELPGSGKPVTKGWIYVLIGTLITASFGLYNNFPFLYPDSAAYLESGIDSTIPADRPIFYGIFLRLCHMVDNLYFCILVQSALLAVVLYLPFSVTKSSTSRGAWYLLTVLVLTLTTSWSFYASYLMPDFFGIILFISTWLLLFFSLNHAKTILLALLLMIAILVHNAHFMLFVGMIVVYLLMVLVSKWRPVPIPRVLGIVISIVVLTFVTRSTVTYFLSDHVIRPKSGHIFLTSRLNETGILHEFLQRKCGTNTYPLCAYRDSLTADYLWDPNSPMHKIGGWKADPKGYSRMLGDMRTDGHTLKRLVVMSFNSTLQQFFSFEIEPHNSMRLSYIKEKFKMHRHDMDISLQNRGNRLEFKALNNRQWIIVLSCFVVFAIILLSRSGVSPIVRRSILFLLCFLLLNAWLFGTFSTVLTRYQGRIISLVPFMFFFWLPEIWPVLRSTFSSMWNNAEKG